MTTISVAPARMPDVPQSYPKNCRRRSFVQMGFDQHVTATHLPIQFTHQQQSVLFSVANIEA
jgi:hypothetical protein